MASKHPIAASEPENTGLSLERLVFFSDAVMAIAITLLAVDLKVPEIPAATTGELLRGLNELAPQIVSFVISFTVIGIYWSGHHRYFGFIQAYDGRLVALNLLFLFTIAAMPFFSSMLGRYPYLSAGVIPYAADVAAIGISMSAIWWYASGARRFIDESLPAQQVRLLRLRPLIPPAIFILSIPIALYRPFLGTIFWLTAPLAVLAVPRLIRETADASTGISVEN